VLSLVVIAAAAVLRVDAGQPLAAALQAARRGDVVELGPGVHHGTIRAAPGVTVCGAGEGVTVVEAPEGEPAAAAGGALALSGLTLLAGRAQCGLEVRAGGAVEVRDAALSGGACGASVAGGRLDAERTDLRGGRQALRVEGGAAALAGGTLRGAAAGLAVRGGSAAVEDAVVSGPAAEAAVSVSGGEAALTGVVIASPGAVGIAVSGGRLRATGVTVGGASQRDGPAACVEAIGGELTILGSELVRCGGTGLAASAASVRMAGVDVHGGASGCVAVVDGGRADLEGVRCTGRGPGLYLAGGAVAQLEMNQWQVDPKLVVECGTGSRAQLLYGEEEREPCKALPAPASPHHR
jgi:hypothetical protein